MDDGKVNVFSPGMLQGLHEAFDMAERDETVVVLTGRPGAFSAGFDLRVLAGPRADALALLRLGATLAGRILAFPAPVAASCSGHAFPAGAFLLMAADVRLGADGPFQLGLNEVRLGLTLPLFAAVLARHRLTPAAFDRAAVTGSLLDPHGGPRRRAARCGGCARPTRCGRAGAPRTTWPLWIGGPTPPRSGASGGR